MTKYIDADALLSKYGEKHFNGEITSEEYYAIKIPLDYAPTADVVEVKHAIWMPIQRGDKGYSAGDFICSCCGKPNKCDSITDYCCSCGAKMERRETNGN